MSPTYKNKVSKTHPSMDPNIDYITMVPCCLFVLGEPTAVGIDAVVPRGHSANLLNASRQRAKLVIFPGAIFRIPVIDVDDSWTSFVGAILSMVGVFWLGNRSNIL